jgi:uncharacterized membrane protein YgaE (UPF0421/DUF939 family)
MEQKNNKIIIELPGLRNIKTVLAVLLCLVIYEFLGRDAFLPCITAIITLQGTVHETIKIGTDRIFATIFGGVIGIIFMSIGRIITWQYANFVLIPFGVFLIIYMCSKIIKRPDFITVACVCFLGINVAVGTHTTADLTYAISRISDTLIGVLIGMSINFYNPKEKENKKEETNKKQEKAKRLKKVKK